MLWQFVADGGDERAEDLTTDAVKAGTTPGELWKMPVVHMRATFFKLPADSEADAGQVETLTKKNAGAARPFLPWWILSERA